MKKKSVVIITTIALSLIFATVALAGTYSNPAEIISSLTGKTESEVYAERTQGKTFGQVAQENGVLDQFKNEMLEYKKAIIDQRVKDGVITEENGETIKKAIEERVAVCDGTPDPNRERLGQKFGRGLGFSKGMGRGQGMGFGRTLNQ